MRNRRDRVWCSLELIAEIHFEVHYVLRNTMHPTTKTRRKFRIFMCSNISYSLLSIRYWNPRIFGQHIADWTDGRGAAAWVAGQIQLTHCLKSLQRQGRSNVELSFLAVRVRAGW
jgi:hypothetical protein